MDELNYETEKMVNGGQISKILGSRIDKIQNASITSTLGPSIWFSKRLLIVIIMFLNFFNSAFLRHSMNIAVVEMASTKITTIGNITLEKSPEFHWDSTTTGVVISIDSYGGLFSFIGGILVNILGGSKVCAISMIAAALTILLHPATLQISFHLFLACRFLTGLLESIFYVSTAEIFSRWFPKNERSRLISLSYNGSQVGSALVYPFCGLLAHKLGWRMVFYVQGTVCLIISILSLILVQNKPSQDKWISNKELEYILEQTDHSEKKNRTPPYKKILTSRPVWALCICKLSYNWVAFTILGACFPLYVKDLTRMGTDEIGYISSIPSIVYIFMLPLAGTIMDYWKNHANISVTRIHKLVMIISCVSGAIFFLATVIFMNFYTSLGLFVLIQIVLSFVALILQLVTVNLAPNNSSSVSSVAVIFSCLSAIISRTITGYMITNHSIQDWNNCFLLASGILAVGAIIFISFGSSEAQKWSLQSNTIDEEGNSNEKK